MKNTSTTFPFQPPQSQQQLSIFLQEYYTMSIQVQTLQRHILRIQTQNQQQHKFYTDETQKLKLYIDQCENEIKKRQQRQLTLIDRLKQLQTSHLQQLSQHLHSSRNTKLNHQHNNNQLKQSFDKLLKSREIEWNDQRQSMISKMGEMNKVIGEMSGRIRELGEKNIECQREKREMREEVEVVGARLAVERSRVSKMKYDVEEKEGRVRQVGEENQRLMERLKEVEAKLKNNQQKQQPKPIPISISNSCPNCLKLSKLHEIELAKKSNDIDCLKKDIQCLMAFFQIAE